ncbi:hypothetical protein CSC35_5113 [Enterobacter hormaechei]|uniref:Uncharacterized protein n=4 Tax=Enterobacteriaceae TaxID=543 RepID=A0A345WWV1_ECOLX|nr:hypothetical protein [Escherichia coli]EHC84112.1 hypothetical protein LTSEMON_6347 [Salmonella enterica subsp. enterica serovar Montevideo str. S5-403]QIM11205.1 hypothetical protein [Leclercia sp.]QJR97462.1 hypothetical protein [Salmonella sp.]RAL71398.1 hypothetical protein CSC35_5113 [Enterobacter hormaechei]SPN80311.1 hypothetical protein PCNR481_0133 [Klebsiella pneumoniae]
MDNHSRATTINISSVFIEYESSQNAGVLLGYENKAVSKNKGH